MSSPAARAAIIAELARLAGSLPIIETDDDPRMDAVPATDAAWLAVVFSSVSEDLASIGTRGADCWDERGVVQLHHFAPAGSAATPAINELDRIRCGLRASRLADTVVLSASPPMMVGVSGRWVERVSFVEIERRNFG